MNKNDDNGLTYSFNICSHCKSICCIDAKPPLTVNRKKLLKEYALKNNIQIGDPFVYSEYPHVGVAEGAYCNFFNKATGKCIVHDVKPETCVAGPITFDINFKTKKIEWFLKKKEICAYAGILFDDKVSLEEHFKEARKQLLDLVKDLSADELRAIVKIEEPQTFKLSDDDLPLEVAKKLGL